MSAKWEAVPQLPKAHYSVDFAWKNIERSLASFADGVELRLDPDYQRGHVWTEDQQRAMGGEVGRVLTWNSLDWPQALTPIELVDGKQRLTAVRRFIAGEIKCFGMRFARGDHLGLDQVFSFRVCSLSAHGRGDRPGAAAACDHRREPARE